MEDCSTDERLQQETLCHRQWTDEYVERPETLLRQNVVVVTNGTSEAQLTREKKRYKDCIVATSAE